MDVVVVEMDTDAKIGLDFMVSHDVIVDIVGMIMHIKRKNMPFGQVRRTRVLQSDCYRKGTCAK